MPKFGKIFFAVFFPFVCLYSEAEDCPNLLRGPDGAKLMAEVRLRAIHSLDKLLTWTLQPQNPTFVLNDPPTQETFKIGGEGLKEFVKYYGYFSSQRPIFGIATDSSRDIEVVNCLFTSLADRLKQRELDFARNEVLAKLLAYRSLKKGMEVEFAGGYIVDRTFNIWKGMPAFGLIPKNSEDPPILLFRGTDLNIVSEKGWASIMCDLDPNGPGQTAYLKGRSQLRAWLRKVGSKHSQARAVGFSLGGIFVLYALTYDHDLLSKKHLSVAFNPPGVSSKVLSLWNEIPKELQPPHIAYVNQGDYVSQVGRLLPDTWEIRLPKKMKVIEAHLTFVSAKEEFSIFLVDVLKENARRRDRR